MTDYFKDLLPLALEYGMSTKEFWEDDPELFWAYRFSYLERIRREKEMFNERAWLQGAYFYDAVSVALSQAFGDKKAQYRDTPYELEQDKNREETPKQNLLEEQLKARAKKIEELLGGKKNDKQLANNSNNKCSKSK